MNEDGKIEVLIPVENKQESEDILQFMRSLDTEIQNNFSQFLQGVKYGMFLAAYGKRTA